MPKRPIDLVFLFFFLHCTHLILRTTESIISLEMTLLQKKKKRKSPVSRKAREKRRWEGGQFNYVRVHLNHPAEQVAELKRWRPTVWRGSVLFNGGSSVDAKNAAVIQRGINRRKGKIKENKKVSLLCRVIFGRGIKLGYGVLVLDVSSLVGRPTTREEQGKNRDRLRSI